MLPGRSQAERFKFISRDHWKHFLLRRVYKSRVSANLSRFMPSSTDLKPRDDAASRSRPDAAEFAARLAQAGPHRIIEEAVRAMPGRLAVVSSFGTESAVLLKFVADVDPSLPILFLDTLWLFKETLAYRDTLIAHLALTDVRTITPSPSTLEMRDPKRDLCFRNHDACCGIRKVGPLEEALAAFDGWISGRKRYQGGDRAGLEVVETDGRRIKFNPLARLKPAELQAIFELARLPRHPLETTGFASVGCIPCTSRGAGGAARSGRWSGLAKTECGIHASVAVQTSA